MSFPTKFIGIPIGWKARGNTGYLSGQFTGRICRRCGAVLHIGVEDNQSFCYCPRCLEKIPDHYLEDYYR